LPPQKIQNFLRPVFEEDEIHFGRSNPGAWGRVVADVFVLISSIVKKKTEFGGSGVVYRSTWNMPYVSALGILLWQPGE